MQSIKAPTKPETKRQFSINIKKCRLLFEPLFKTINSNTVLPILEDILVGSGNGTISYTITDLENITTVELPAKTQQPFWMMLPGIELKYLIRHCICESLEVSLSEKPGHPDIYVKSENFQLRLPANRPQDYPKPVIIENEKTFAIDTKDLIPELVNALKFVSHDWLRPAMTGINFTNIDGYLFVASTDAHKMYWKQICKTPKGFKEADFILSEKAAKLILLMSKGEKDVSIDLAPPHLRFRFHGKSITTKLLDAKYPNFQAVIPPPYPLRISLHRRKLQQAIEICLPFTNKSTYQINLTVRPNEIKIDGGDKDFSIDFEHKLLVYKTNLDTFTPFSFGVNARFLLTAISCSKEEFVTIDTSMTPLKAIIVDTHALVMPLMINA